MNSPNELMNFLHQFIQMVEAQASDIANELEWWQTNKPNNTMRQDRLADRLSLWVSNHDDMEHLFNQLLVYLQSSEDYVRTLHTMIESQQMKISHLEYMNKDAIYWRDKAMFYQRTRTTLYNQLKKERDGKKVNNGSQNSTKEESKDIR